MSRDWTPQETNMFDKHLKATQGRSMKDQKFYLIRPDGTKVPLESKRTSKLRKQYPEFGFLYDNLEMTYVATSAHPKFRNKIFNEIEKKIVYYNEHNNSNGNDNDPIWLWYIGKLDSNFYYRERNNMYLHEYIIEEIQKMTGGDKIV